MDEGDDGGSLPDTGAASGGDTGAAAVDIPDLLEVEEPRGVKNNSSEASGTDGGTKCTMVEGKIEAKETNFVPFMIRHSGG